MATYGALPGKSLWFGLAWVFIDGTCQVSHKRIDAILQGKFSCSES